MRLSVVSSNEDLKNTVNWAELMFRKRLRDRESEGERINEHVAITAIPHIYLLTTTVTICSKIPISPVSNVLTM